jgi:plasmid stability protein
MRHEIANMLAEQGRHEKAEQQWRDLLTDWVRVLGPDHPGNLTIRHEIARMLAEQGHHKQAEQEYRDVLTAMLQILGPDHPSTAAAIGYLGRGICSSRASRVRW